VERVEVDDVAPRIVLGARSAVRAAPAAVLVGCHRLAQSIAYFRSKRKAKR
jgi:hypothetical protein